jgi:hypothetical protein
VNVRPQKERFVPLPFAAPVGGLNTADAAVKMPAEDAHALVNMIAAENGLRPRLGFAEWCTGIGSGTTEIRSVLPFTSAAGGGANDRLFVATTLGIYDCTATSAAPTRVVTFGIQDGNSGYGNFWTYTNAAGVKFLLYWDASNGYYTYDESGPTWTQVPAGAGAGQINNVNPNALVFGLGWKSRIWMIEKDSTRAWYLPAGAIYGNATAFDFGQQFRAGGKLAALYAWTMDGGAGADDMLVAVSTAGDVVVYQGVDPATSFGRLGGWFVGGVPSGRRLAATNGGELLLLTSYGLIPISSLVAGRSLLSPDTQATRKVRNLFNATMNDRRSLLGWSIFQSPQDGSMIITYPALAGENRQQFAASLTTSGWAQYSGLPIFAADTWRGALYFGTSDGRLCIHTGGIDNVARDGTLAQALPISWSGITHFDRNGSSKQKMVKQIRPIFITQGANPAVAVQARYDFDLTPVSVNPVTPSVPANAWDSALWDTAVWSGGQARYTPMFGASGCGTHIAIAFSGTSIQRMSLVGFDTIYDPGGFL